MTCERSTDFEAATGSPEATMFSRSISDRLILCVLSLKKGGGPPRPRPPSGVGPPRGPPLVLREPQFLNIRLAGSASPTNDLALNSGRLDALFALQAPCRECGPKLRQCCCPNSDHAKFLSTTQADESRLPSWSAMLSTWTSCLGFAASAPRSRPRTAEIGDEIPPPG